jgi:hypothetical protein
VLLGALRGLVIGFRCESGAVMTLRECRPLRPEYRGYNRVFINTNWFHAREFPFSRLGESD